MRAWGQTIKSGTMKYMQISVWKDAENNRNRQGYMKNKRFYNLTWFKNPAFRKSDSKKNQKDYLRKALSKVDFMEKPHNVSFDEKERVIVTVQGQHSLEDAIFDEEMTLPDNLIDNNKNSNRGDGKKW